MEEVLNPLMDVKMQDEPEMEMRREADEKTEQTGQMTSRSQLPPVINPALKRGSARKSASGRKTFKASPREDPISLSLPPMSERQLGNLNTNSATTGFDSNKRLTYQRQTSSFWKGNVDIDTWLKEKVKRDNTNRSKKTRQALKDAQWVLDHREVQAKQIQRRNKLERLDEHQRELQLEKERKMAKVLAMRAAAGESAIASFRRSDSIVSRNTQPDGNESHEGLLWRECPSSRITKRLPKITEAAIWVKPGHFANTTISP